MTSTWSQILPAVAKQHPPPTSRSASLDDVLDTSDASLAKRKLINFAPDFLLSGGKWRRRRGKKKVLSWRRSVTKCDRDATAGWSEMSFSTDCLKPNECRHEEVHDRSTKHSKLFMSNVFGLLEESRTPWYRELSKLCPTKTGTYLPSGDPITNHHATQQKTTRHPTLVQSSHIKRAHQVCSCQFQKPVAGC